MSNYSTKQLSQALSIQQQIDALDQKREELTRQLQAVLSPTGGATKKPAAKSKSRTPRLARGVRKGSQKDLLRQVLAEADQPLSLDDILDRMKAKGFKSTSANPKRSLSVLLYTDSQIQRASRGHFRIRPSSGAAAATTPSPKSTRRTAKPKTKRTTKRKAKKRTTKKSAKAAQ